MAYLNDIIIYLNNKQEHEEYVKQVLKKLYKKDMPVIIKKCEFYTRKTNFIGFIIELKQISIDLKKIKAIINQQDLKNIIGLRLFLGFCNYYQKFIANWLDKTEPFTKITKKSKIWKQGKEQQELFKKIKNKFIKELILKIYRQELLIKVKTDLLDFALGVCIVQRYKNGIQHLVAYYS